MVCAESTPLRAQDSGDKLPKFVLDAAVGLLVLGCRFLGPRRRGPRRG